MAEPRMNGAQRIAAERQRQIGDEGYTPAHDAHHANGALAYAAACYAAPKTLYLVEVNDGGVAWWEPWPHNWRRSMARFGDQKVYAPGERIRELEKAGALIAAEIDRLLASEGGA